MKITCDCGNEMEFEIVEQDAEEEEEFDEDEGQYARVDHAKFYFWERHDVVGIQCRSCGKSIWIFT